MNKAKDETGNGAAGSGSEIVLSRGGASGNESDGGLSDWSTGSDGAGCGIASIHGVACKL